LGLELHEAGAILLLPFVLLWLPPLKVAEYKGVLLYVSLTGCLLPFFISLGFVYSGKISILKFLGGTAIIAFITYFGSYAQAEVGVVVRTVILVPFIASYYALRIAERGEPAPLAYSVATIGTLIGADVLRMHELVRAQIGAENSLMVAIGGGGIRDAIFISGTVSVVLCLLFMLYAIVSSPENELGSEMSVKTEGKSSSDDRKKIVTEKSWEWEYNKKD